MYESISHSYLMKHPMVVTNIATTEALTPIWTSGRLVEVIFWIRCYFSRCYDFRPFFGQYKSKNYP